ncbi:MAG: NAD(P)/FAD-dependent oxidoreductase [Chloroflexi bacterium]|nr:NAD(P)/FAD-dependent oxidoreductase [Chloroflexota bacterium]
MTEKSIIVIGAGLAGLSAGCYAQMNGYRCHTFEHHSKPGGVAAAWKREGYLIDGGIHFLIGHRPGQPIFELYRELGIQTDDFPTLITYSRFIDEASGVSLDITGDLERLMHDLKAIAPADAGLIDDLVAGACAMQGSTILFEAGTGKPPELMNPLDLLRQFWSMRRTFKYFTGKYAKPLANYALAAHSQLLRQTLENLFLPEVPVWFVFMLMALLADGQIGLLPTGCRGFVMPIEERYKALGGTMTYEATVKEIIVEDDRAVGVSLIDGSTHRADVVISAADGHSTIFKMLGGRYVTKKTRERYCNWKLIRPVLMVSFGVAREFPDDPHMSFIILKDAITVGNQEIVGFSLRIFNYSTGFAPRGKTVVQVMLETEWDFWNDLQEDRQRYEAEKQRVAKKVLARLEAHYPGISSLVEVTDVVTPYTTWRYTLNYKGAYMGWLPTPKALMTTIPRTLPGLANFYIAGQWVLPGGGVPPCLYSGRHVIQILCKRDRKPFSSTTG